MAKLNYPQSAPPMTPAIPRCLACWDGGLRAGALHRAGQGEVGLAVFLPLYPRLVDWLAEKLGSFQNRLLAQGAS